MPVNLDSHFVFNMNILNVQIFFSHTAGTYEMYENLYHMNPLYSMLSVYSILQISTW